MAVIINDFTVMHVHSMNASVTDALTFSLVHATISLSMTGCEASCPASFVSMLSVYAFISCQINASRTKHNIPAG